MIARAERHEHIGRHRRLEILGPGIDQQVARHECVGKTLVEERLQSRNGVEKLIGLPRVLGTPGAVRVGIALVIIVPSAANVGPGSS